MQGSLLRWRGKAISGKLNGWIDCMFFVSIHIFILAPVIENKICEKQSLALENLIETK